MNVNKQEFMRYLKTAYKDSFPDHFSFIQMKVIQQLWYSDFELLKKAYDTGIEKGLNLKVGNVLTAGLFYNDNSELEKWAKV